jgi:ABC-type nitrate/sulfonate/bicarbonate transport system substrate-binding protein
MKWALWLLIIGLLSLIMACGQAAPAAPPPAEEAVAEEAASPAEEPEPALEMESITFQAGYLPQGNISFIPAYVAKEKGFFEEQGLDVTIEHTPPGTGAQFQQLAAKNIEFITSPSDTHLKGIDQSGTPFIAVITLGHAADHALMVLDNGEIEKLEDIKGKLVGYKFQPDPWLLSMLTSVDLSLDDVELVPVGFDPRVLLPESGEGKVDALQVFKSNEPDILTHEGHPVKVFYPEDFGVHFLGQNILTHRDFITERPEMVQRFVKAFLKGLEYSVDPANTEEVVDIILMYAGKDADRDHNRFIYQTEIEPSYITGPGTGEVGLGYATDQEWQDMIAVMLEFGGIEKEIPLDQVVDMQFVEAAYENGKLIWP